MIISYLESPTETIDIEGRRVDRVSLALELRELRHAECLLIVARDNLRLEVRQH